MAVEYPVTILGGLPVIASVSFTGPDWYGEYDAEVNALYWRRRDDSKGKEVTKAIYDRLYKFDPYWQSDVTEQVSEGLAHDHYVAEEEAKACLILTPSPPATACVSP